MTCNDFDSPHDFMDKIPEKTVGQNPAQWVDLHMKPQTVLGMFS